MARSKSDIAGEVSRSFSDYGEIDRERRPLCWSSVPRFKDVRLRIPDEQTDGNFRNTADHGTEANRPVVRAHGQSEEIEVRRVERALAYVAHLIEDRPEGQAYWPIFERLEHEHDRLASRSERLRRAKSRCRSSE